MYGHQRLIPLVGNWNLKILQKKTRKSCLFILYRKVVIKLDHMEERVTRLEVKMENIEEKDKVTQSHLKKLRDNIDRNEKLVNELQNVCNTLNILIDELRSDRERERNTRNKYVFWFLTTVFTVLITALLTLIII